MLCGDDNTPFFHKYSSYRKDINSIWKIADNEGNVVEGFESIACAGVHHFETLFQEEKDLHLPEVVKSTGLFPSSISEGDNEDLMKEVTLQEILSILSLSKNDKIPGSDGIPVEVYRSLFDVLGEDLLRVVEDSRKLGKIPAVFNTTFIALIPKIDQPKMFDDFRPISLCNYIYKIMSKIYIYSNQEGVGRLYL